MDFEQQKIIENLVVELNIWEPTMDEIKFKRLSGLSFFGENKIEYELSINSLPEADGEIKLQDVYHDNKAIPAYGKVLMSNERKKQINPQEAKTKFENLSVLTELVSFVEYMVGNPLLLEEERKQQLFKI